MVERKILYRVDMPIPQDVNKDIIDAAPIPTDPKALEDTLIAQGYNRNTILTAIWTNIGQGTMRLTHNLKFQAAGESNQQLFLDGLEIK